MIPSEVRRSALGRCLADLIATLRRGFAARSGYWRWLRGASTPQFRHSAQDAPAPVPSRWLRVAGWSCVIGVAVMAIEMSGSAAGQEAPIIVDADRVTYEQVTQKIEAAGNVRIQFRGIRVTADYALVDLAEEQLAARGHVVVVDPQGREVRGEALIYNARTNELEMMRAQTLVNRVYISSDRLQAGQQRIVADTVTVTTCDPDHPAYRITASRIEVVPGERIVAHDASLWLGGWKVFTLPTYTISLRTAQETVRTSVPRVGYDNVDGIWVSYDYPYALGNIQGTLIGKYAVQQGLMVRTLLEHTTPVYLFTLTVGRNQDQNLRIYDQAELVATLPTRRLGGLPLSWWNALSAGWFRDPATGVQSSRFQYTVGVSADRVTLGPVTSAGISVSYQQATYSVGAIQGVLRVNADVTHQLSESTTLSATYGLVEVTGGSPFAFDAVALGDRIHEIAVMVNHRGLRLGSLETELLGGTTYSFRDNSTAYTAGVAVATSGGISIGAQASYNATAGIYKDIDYFIAARICDCFIAKLRYRQVRQQIWFDLGLIGFTEPQPALPIFP